jgi:hypothetical protein
LYLWTGVTFNGNGSGSGISYTQYDISSDWNQARCPRHWKRRTSTAMACLTYEL